jgi:hypothetical protein
LSFLAREKSAGPWLAGPSDIRRVDSTELAGLWYRFSLPAASALHGTLLDYTDRHGVDRRIHSPALQRPQSLYVYLPPEYDPQKSYPLVIYLHAGMQDVESFLPVVAILDQLVSCGQLPPLLVAAPDGSLCPGQFGSFFINGPAGNYHDWVAEDVYAFVTTRFNVRPEPEATFWSEPRWADSVRFNLA